MPRETAQELAKRLGLEYGVDVVCKHDSTEKDKWNTIITRNGYRKAVSAEIDYLRHMVYPIYDNTEIVIDGDNVRVSVNGRKTNLVGAIGFLWKAGLDGPFVMQVDMDDYEHLEGTYWTNMKVVMLSKIAEVGLLRIAYPALFSGTYSPEEYTTGEHESDSVEDAAIDGKIPLKKEMIS